MEDADADYELDFDAASETSPRRDGPLESAVSDLLASAPPSPPAREMASPVDLSVYASPVLRPPTRAKPPAPPPRKPVRTALDRVSYMFTVRAKRIRALRIPIASAATALSGSTAFSTQFPTIRHLRVFAVVEKQPMQTHGSRWKQEARVAEAAKPLVVVRRAAASPSSATSPGRRSGVLQEAAWRNDDGDLQWVLTMDRFRRLKAYSPRIKLYVFGIGANAHAESVRALSEDSPKTHRESIVSLGWFFLDLRTPDLPERWFKLQNSPFGGEILVSTSFLPSDVERERPRNMSRSQPPPSLLTATRRREHALSADSEYLRLGGQRGSDAFLFTVFIRGATKLLRVLQSSVASEEEERRAVRSGFWLSYSLFDVVVQSDVFYNLERAEFAPIRDSFRVLSSKHDVRAFLETQKLLSIYLCTHDRVLASADVPFASLLAPESFLSKDSDLESALIDGPFVFGDTEEGEDEGCVLATFSVERSGTMVADEIENSNAEDNLRAADDDETKCPVSDLARQDAVRITVSYVKLSIVTLRRYAEKESIELEVLHGEQAVRCPIRFNAFTADYAVGECPDLSLEIGPDAASSISVTCFSSATDNVLATSPDDRPSSEVEREMCLPLIQNGHRLGECNLVVQVVSTDMNVNAGTHLHEQRRLPGVSHAYRLFIGLKSLRHFETSRPVVISYTNPFTNHELVETPLISVLRKAETEVHDAYCLFELHQDEASMQEAMQSSIVMDVSLALPDGSRDVIGSAIFSLNFLYYSQTALCCADPSCEGLFKDANEASAHRREVHQDLTDDTTHQSTHSLRTCSIYLPVMTVQGNGRSAHPSRRVGAIQVEAYIEDAGPMSESDVRLVEEMRVPRIVRSPCRRVGLDISSNQTVGNSTERHDVRDTFLERPEHPKQDEKDKSGEIALTSIVDGSFPVETTKEFDEIKSRLLQERTAWLKEQKKQQVEWKKRVAEMEKARMDELEEEWARREEERSTVLKSAQAEYQKLEQKLRATLSEVEARERKLSLAESTLERDQRMLREDTDLLRKRLQAEQSHSLTLAQKQIDALEKRAAELQTHLHVAEKRASQVEEDFVEYRKHQRKMPESKLREEISSLKGQVAELAKAKQLETRARENAEANTDKMKTQLERMAKLVQAEKKKNEMRVVDEIEKLRLKYMAREERYVLDGDREELRAIKKQLDDLRRVHVSGSKMDHTSESHASKGLPQHRELRVKTRRLGDTPSPRSRGSMSLQSSTRIGRRHSWSSNEASPRPSPIAKSCCRHGDENAFGNAAHSDREVRRLEAERDSLLTSDAYDEDSYLVRELERRIVIRRDQLAQQQHGM